MPSEATIAPCKHTLGRTNLHRKARGFERQNIWLSQNKAGHCIQSELELKLE